MRSRPTFPEHPVIEQARLFTRTAEIAGLCTGMYSAFQLEIVARARSNTPLTPLAPLTEARREAWVATWARAMLRVMHVQVHGLAAFQPDRQPDRHEAAKAGRIIVANHRSTLDTLLMLSRFQGRLLAKGDMANWKGLGALASIGGTLFVDRNDPHSGARAITEMRTHLAAGRTVGVFPEGTTFAGDEVRPFHAGAFVAAVRAKVPIIPVGIAYASEEAIFGDEDTRPHVERLLKMPVIHVAMAQGDAIPPSSQLGKLAEQAREAVQDQVTRARALLASVTPR